MTDNLKFLLKGLNQKPIAYYPIYAKVTGSVVSGIMLSQLMYWFSCTSQDKIYKTNRDFAAELQLTGDIIKSAKIKIKNLAFITVTREGAPAKTYYSIDWEIYASTLESVLADDTALYVNPKDSLIKHHKKISPIKKSVDALIPVINGLLAINYKIKVDKSDIPYLNFTMNYINETITNRPYLLNSTQVTQTFIINCVDEVRKVVVIDKIPLTELTVLLKWTEHHKFWADKLHRLTLLRKKGKNNITRIGNIKAQYMADNGDQGFKSEYTTDISTLYKKDIEDGYSDVEAGKRRMIRKKLKKEGKDYVVIK